MYKKAIRLNLLFPTPKGLLTIQQVWTLPKKDLEVCIKSYYNKIKETEKSELDFLEDDCTEVNEEDILRFEILKDIYNTLKEERVKKASEMEIKEHNQKIMELIKAKQEDTLKNLSIEELKKLLK